MTAILYHTTYSRWQSDLHNSLMNIVMTDYSQSCLPCNEQIKVPPLLCQWILSPGSGSYCHSWLGCKKIACVHELAGLFGLGPIGMEGDILPFTLTAETCFQGQSHKTFTECTQFPLLQQMCLCTQQKVQIQHPLSVAAWLTHVVPMHHYHYS